MVFPPRGTAEKVAAVRPLRIAVDGLYLCTGNEESSRGSGAEVGCSQYSHALRVSDVRQRSRRSSVWKTAVLSPAWKLSRVEIATAQAEEGPVSRSYRETGH